MLIYRYLGTGTGAPDSLGKPLLQPSAFSSEVARPPALNIFGSRPKVLAQLHPTPRTPPTFISPMRANIPQPLNFPDLKPCTT